MAMDMVRPPRRRGTQRAHGRRRGIRRQARLALLRIIGTHRRARLRRHNRTHRPVRPRQRAFPPCGASLQLRQPALEDPAADRPDIRGAIPQRPRRAFWQRGLRTDVGLADNERHGHIPGSTRKAPLQHRTPAVRGDDRKPPRRQKPADSCRQLLQGKHLRGIAHAQRKPDRHAIHHPRPVHRRRRTTLQDESGADSMGHPKRLRKITGRPREPARRHAVVVRAFHRKHVSGHRLAMGHELLDPADRRERFRMAVCLHRQQNPGHQADPPAFPLDQRLRRILPDARDRQARARQQGARLVVQPQGRGRTPLLLQGISRRL